VSSVDIWAILGIESTRDVPLIRRAYAAALKRARPDEDPVAFADLRQAYEQALMRAQRVGAPGAGPAGAVRVQAPVAPPEPAPAPATSSETSAPEPPLAPTTPSDLDQLREAFASLQRAAITPAAPNPDELQALLDACLRSPALENLSIQLEFEPALIRFFGQTLPRTQFLLETIIDHWKWRDRPRSAGGAGVAALVAHADDLRRLENLHASEPRAYLALTRPPRPWLLWPQMVLFRLEISVRDAMGEFRNLSPGLFDTRALEWWGRFFNRPHIQPGLIRGSGVLALLGAVFGGLTGADHERFLHDAGAGGLIGVFTGLVITALWLGLVDWPRYRLRATRYATSPWLRLGRTSVGWHSLHDGSDGEYGDLPLQ
jgi:hypothetical protein